MQQPYLLLKSLIKLLNKLIFRIMQSEKNMLSATRLNYLRDQGYTVQSNKELSNMAFGIRFPYRLCVIILITAIATQSIALFAAMTVLAFLGVVLPNHPFDYIYNYILSGWMDKPRIPARSVQLKFACSIATSWLVAVDYLLYSGATTAGLIMAAVLVLVAMFPSVIDLCIPSLIYKTLFLNKGKTGSATS